jgi:hypothetical protein
MQKFEKRPDGSQLPGYCGLSKFFVVQCGEEAADIKVIDFPDVLVDE